MMSLLAFAGAAAGIAGCGAGGGDCRGLTGRAAAPDMLVLLSRRDGDLERVVSEVRSDANSRFEFQDLATGTYVVRTLQPTPDFTGQQPFYQGLYVDSEVVADVPGICGPLGATDTNEERE